jgi:alkylation response protein AidB-like acyl-CoA dehydrogenase
MLNSAVPLVSGSEIWLQRTRALGPMIDAAAAADENATELTSEVVEAIDAAGLFAIMAPAELGGAEAHPDDVIDAISELSYWDGSAGWYSHAVMTGGAVAGAFLGPRAVAEVFRGNHFQRAAGQAAPTGTAERTDGGYRISGRYSFGSGTPHARWIVGGYMLQEGGAPVLDAGGQPTMLIGLAPRESVRFHGNWDVLGLRGTGSYDFEVTEQVLPADFFFNAAAPVQQRGGALYRMGFMAIPCISHASFALGAARRMLDEWLAHARGKMRGAGKASDLHTFRRDFASATADLQAADAYVRRIFSALYDAASTGQVTTGMQLQGQLATSHAFTVAKRVADTAFAACTTHALRGGNALQRCFRDIHAGAAHVLNSEQALIDAGAVLAGTEGAETPLTREGYSL